MSNEVIKVSDNPVLVPAANYPHAKWDFEHLNPVQSRLYEIYDGVTNVAIAAATSAGKTICSEMYLAHEIRKNGGKGIYVGPLKALAKEKEQDWSNPEHHFSTIKTAICTGDYRFTAKRIKEVDESDLVVMTPEMLASRCRNASSDKSQFLKEVGVVVFDESHLLTVPSRGDHIEVALMKLTEINPNVRIVLLSATMPNVSEICEWVSNITHRPTYYLESDYRPCPLTVHYETYYDGDTKYDDKELSKIATACSIVEYYPDDKFLIFVHTKRTGHLMVETLERYGIDAEFHNADLGLKERMRLEEKFKSDKKFRALVATSTLAWGLNLPARRVIVTGVHRGMSEVENYDINQMIGRAGRPRYDPRGDAYILIPEGQKSAWITKLKHKPVIRSTLLEHVGTPDNPHYKTLAFHIVAEIHQGNVKTKDGFVKWFRRSLAHFQDHAFNDSVIERTVNSLEQYKAIVVNEQGEYECTGVGKIASMFYFSPFDVSELRRNFFFLFRDGFENNDFAVSLAMANIDSFRWMICNRQEKEAIALYKAQIDKMYGRDRYQGGVYKMGCAYYNLLKGKKDSPVLQALMGTLLSDLDRTMQVLVSLDATYKWEKSTYIKTLGMRIRYGVEADLVELCQIPNVGQVRAKKLKARNIKTLSDFLKYDATALAGIMKVSTKVATEMITEANSIHLKDSL